MLYRGSLPHITLRFFLLCYGATLLLSLGYAQLLYQNTQKAYGQQVALVAGQVERYLAQQQEMGEKVLRDVATQITARQGEVTAVRDILDGEINRKSLPLRVAWSDAQMRLRVGTAIGIFDAAHPADYLATYALNLSDRDYIRQARQKPGEIVMSGLLRHKVTGRAIFAQALGVADEKGRYLGTLARIIDQQSLVAFLEGSLSQQPILAELRLPGGEVLYSNFTLTPSSPSRIVAGGYQLVTRIDPAFTENLLQEHIRHSALLTAAISLAFVATYYGFAQRLSQPVQEIMQLLFGVNRMEEPQAVPNLAMHSLLPRIEEIRALLRDYDALKNQLHDREEKLQHAVQLMQGIRGEYYDTLGSLSRELQQAFDAINAYSATFRDIQHEEAYQQHFEVEEFGLNMKFISNTLYLLCQANGGSLDFQPALLQMDEKMETALEISGEWMEDKTIRVEYATRPLPFRHDERLMQNLLEGLLFTLWRYMAYGSKTTLHLRMSDKRLFFTADIHMIDDIFQPKKNRDISLFIPSRRKSTPQEIAQHLETHINMKMLRMLVMLCGGTVELSPLTAHSLRMQLSLREA